MQQQRCNRCGCRQNLGERLVKVLQSFSENVRVDPYGMLLVDRRIADDARQERQGCSILVRYGDTVKKICNPLACEIVENPRTQKSSDVLSGKFRQGATILITDLAHHIGTSSGRHDVGMGLHDMGWNIDLCKIHEAEPALPIAKFRETVNNVIEYLSHGLNDLGQVTVHVWLSLQFLHDAKPPHNVVVPPSFQKEFIQCVTDLDQASSRPLIVAINTDSLFNGMDSITSRLAVELTESLKREGVMVTTDQRMWRSMHSQFGNQFSPLRTARRGTLGKNAIWSVIEKKPFQTACFPYVRLKSGSCVNPQRGRISTQTFWRECGDAR